MGIERCIELVRDGLGPRDIPVEIENVQRWRASADAAERSSEGRIFLAGDAAHTMPPTGGFGGNTGVQDGYDLAWKLVYVLQGHAGEGLLATYDAERRPVGKFTVEQAYTRYVVRLAPELGKENLLPYVPEATVELGYRYDSPAIVHEGDGERPICENPLEPSASPGARVPHLWVEHDGAKVSTVDLTGTELVLFAGPDGSAWVDAGRLRRSVFRWPPIAWRRTVISLIRATLSQGGTGRIARERCCFGPTASSPGARRRPIQMPRLFSTVSCVRCSRARTLCFRNTRCRGRRRPRQFF